MTENITYMNECYSCIHRRAVPGNTHIRCVNPDHEMKGDPYGIINGWFNYPQLFDPIWKNNYCNNFEAQ